MRRELNLLLSAVETSRPPAVRRSSRNEWLYVTDAAGLLSVEEQAKLKRELSASGWDSCQEMGWLFLRKRAATPPEGWFEGRFGPEAACCQSLLDRHAEDCMEDPEAVQRVLIKAGEKGEEAYENICRAIHRDWAERLRLKRPLPAVNRNYFGV